MEPLSQGTPRGNCRVLTGGEIAVDTELHEGASPTARTFFPAIIASTVALTVGLEGGDPRRPKFNKRTCVQVKGSSLFDLPACPTASLEGRRPNPHVEWSCLLAPEPAHQRQGPSHSQTSTLGAQVVQPGHQAVSASKRRKKGLGLQQPETPTRPAMASKGGKGLCAFLEDVHQLDAVEAIEPSQPGCMQPCRRFSGAAVRPRSCPPRDAKASARICVSRCVAWVGLGDWSCSISFSYVVGLFSGCPWTSARGSNKWRDRFVPGRGRKLS